MMLDITERICSAYPLKRQPQIPLANADVRRQPNRKWATQWAKIHHFQIYSMKTTEAGGDGGRHSMVQRGPSYSIEANFLSCLHTA